MQSLTNGEGIKYGCLSLTNPIKSSVLHFQAHTRIQHRVYTKAKLDPSFIHAALHRPRQHIKQTVKREGRLVKVIKLKIGINEWTQRPRNKILQFSLVPLSCCPLNCIVACCGLLGLGDQIKMSWGTGGLCDWSVKQQPPCKPVCSLSHLVTPAIPPTLHPLFLYLLLLSLPFPPHSPRPPPPLYCQNGKI